MPLGKFPPIELQVALESDLLCDLQSNEEYVHGLVTLVVKHLREGCERERQRHRQRANAITEERTSERNYDIRSENRRF